MSLTAKQREERNNLYEDGFRVLQGQQEYVTYQEDSSFRMWYSDVPWRYDPHVHSAVEVVLTLEGEVEYSVGEKRYLIRKDEILIVPPGMAHGLNMNEGSSRLLYLFEPDLFQTLPDLKRLTNAFNRVFYLHDGSDAHVRVREQLLKAAEFYRRKEFLWNTLCYSCVLRMYVTLAQNYMSGSLLQKKAESESSMDREVVVAAMHYINSHYRENLTLEDVADFAGFSRFYFSRSFKQETGFSFKDYLVRKRMQAAMSLLIETSKPMKEVAEESGFGSVATFNRVFREHKHCTPSQYRTIYGKV